MPRALMMWIPLLACLCSPGCSGCEAPVTEALAPPAPSTALAEDDPPPIAQTPPAPETPPPAQTPASQAPAPPATPPTPPTAAEPAQTAQNETPSAQPPVEAPPADLPVSAPRPAPPAAPPAGSPEAAFAQATALDHRAFDKRAQGDFGGAFLDIRAAWKQVSRFPDDENCRRLAGQLLDKLDELAEESNASAAGSLSSSTRLIVK